jgi:hypothetical protein
LTLGGDRRDTTGHSCKPLTGVALAHQRSLLRSNLMEHRLALPISMSHRVLTALLVVDHAGGSARVAVLWCRETSPRLDSHSQVHGDFLALGKVESGRDPAVTDYEGVNDSPIRAIRTIRAERPGSRRPRDSAIPKRPWPQRLAGAKSFRHVPKSRG